ARTARAASDGVGERADMLGARDEEGACRREQTRQQRRPVGEAMLAVSAIRSAPRHRALTAGIAGLPIAAKFFAQLQWKNAGGAAQADRHYGGRRGGLFAPHGAG